ncbi:MAG: FAD-dependent oxidoreductase [Candidatus Woesearchaeota archaeon]
MYDLIIIGGGCAGLTAGIYAARYSLKTLVISREMGGVLNEAHKVCNYPGYKDISGIDLMMKMKDQAESLGVEIIYEEVQKLEKKDDTFTASINGKQFEGSAVVLAPGLKRRRLNIPGENDFVGKGVSYCYTCDAAFYKGKTVAVVGGSDSAALASLLLSQYAEKVYIIYRKGDLRAEPANKKAVEENDNIEIITNTNVVEVKGGKVLERAVLDKPYDGSEELRIDGLFVEVGSVPSTVLSGHLGVELDDNNMIKVDRERRTNIEGVYAGGDATDTPLRQAVTAAADGAIAAFTAYQYIKDKQIKKH